MAERGQTPELAAWRNRITGHADVDPQTIVSHPENWRVHPAAQADALSGLLAEVGVVQSVIVNARSGTLIDGHLRVQLAIERGEPTIPVVYVELSDEEELLVLATLDPLAAMAQTDADALARLLQTITVEDDALAAMLETLAQESALPTPVVPTASEQREPSLASACLIEIRCSLTDRDDFAETLAQWGQRDGVTIDIS